MMPGNENMPEVAVIARPVLLLWLYAIFRAIPAIAA
jgi:hypothetical protein